jgi:hypothetical protein
MPMTTLDRVLPAEYGELVGRLEAVGMRFRLAAGLRGLAWWVLLVVPVAVGVMGVAGSFGLPVWVKVVLLALMGAAGAAGYGVFLHRVLFRRPTYAEIARLVEQHGTLPKAGLKTDNVLINAVLLAQDLEAAIEKGEPKGSAAWIPHVLKEAGRETGAMALERSVPWGKTGQAWLMTGLACAICAVLVGLSPGTFGHGFSVLLTPTQYVPHQGKVKIVSVMPGDDTALAGQALLFSINVEVPEHRAIEAKLTVYPKSGKAATYPMVAFGGENNQYVRQGMTATEDMDYVIQAGDTESRRYHMRVLPQIQMTGYSVEAVPPAYTGQESRRLELKGKEVTAARGVMELPMGSMATVRVGLDGPVKEVLMDVAGGGSRAGKDGEPVAMRADGQGYEAQMRVMEPMRFTVRVNDGANRTLKQFPETGSGTESGQECFTLMAVPDSPPTVLVTEPGRDIDAKPGDKVSLEMQATDDYGLTQVRLEVAKNSAKDFKAVQTWAVGPGKDGKPVRALTVRHVLELPMEEYKFGDTLRYRFVAVDNRDLTAVDATLGRQTTAGQVFGISFNDKSAVTAASAKTWEELRKKLAAILEKQVALRKSADGLTVGMAVAEMRKVCGPIAEGQKGIKTDLTSVTKNFPFEPSMKLVQKSLEVLAMEDAAEAVDRGADIMLLSDGKTLRPLATRLRQHQNRIVDVLQTLLAMVAADQERLTKGTEHDGSDPLTDAKEAWKKLAEELKKFEKEQQGVIDASAALAKKPKDRFDANDLKKLADLAVMEDKWEKFFNERLADLSKVVEQDQANASLLEEVVKMKVELATAKDALELKATEIATTAAEVGLESAQELTTHIERWLQQQPDRIRWQMEDPITPNDPAMAELPRQLQDMVGDLMDKEEDLTQEMESLASKWVDSLDQGAGWDAMDGPISNMSAQGVTGNQLPKDMEIQGRSGEGREGRTSGEMVGAEAEGKEGRRTPTRLTNDPFSNSQVQDHSTLPAGGGGGATGGGKKGALGGEGLEGPASGDQANITQRLAGRQATIRNEAERLNLQMHAAGYDNFKLVESNAYLKKSEDALKQYQYHTALYYQEEAVQSLNTAKVLAAGEMHVIADTSPKAGDKARKDVESALNGPLPKGYGEPVKAYFEKLSGK